MILQPSPHLCKHSMVTVESHPAKVNPVRPLGTVSMAAVAEKLAAGVTGDAAVTARACCCCGGVSLTTVSPEFKRNCAAAVANQARVQLQRWCHGSGLEAADS